MHVALNPHVLCSPCLQCANPSPPPLFFYYYYSIAIVDGWLHACMPLSALMYLYYGLAGMRIRLCKPYYITTMQISQMVVGIAVCIAGGYYIAMGERHNLKQMSYIQ